MTAMFKPRLKVGDRVIDRGGFVGTIVKITEFEGSGWYDVRFGRAGVGVRADCDLTFHNP